MHFLLIGATGRTGQAVLKESLEQGHTVTTLVRDPSKIQDQKGVTVSQGSPMSPEDVSAAFEAKPETRIDAVLVTLNLKRESGSPWAKPVSPANLMEKSVGNVASAMKLHGVRRLVVMSAFGVGDSFPNMACYLRGMVQTSNMGPQYADHDAAHRVVKSDDAIDWIFFRPSRLTEKGKMPVKDHGDVGKGVGGLDSISVASVADTMVKAASGYPEWASRRTPVITN